MEVRGTAVAVLAALAMTSGGAAAAADKRPKPPPSMVARTPAAGGVVFKPNVGVGGVWIGSGTGDRFAPLGHSPRLGETVSLVCDVTVAGSPPPGWRMAWKVDGVTTCGDGPYAVTEHDCLYRWVLGMGSEAFIDWVPHTTGTHTFSCVVDVDGDLQESNETDNSKQVTFTVVKPLQAVPGALIPRTRAPVGPRIRRR